MIEEINGYHSGKHLTTSSRTTATQNFRLHNGVTSLTTIFDCFILPFLPQSDETVMVNPARIPEA